MSYKSSSGGIPIDSLPLNWSKQKNIGQVFEILRLSLGPYGFNNNFQHIDTTSILKAIYKLASDLYNELLSEMSLREQSIQG